MKKRTHHVTEILFIARLLASTRLKIDWIWLFLPHGEIEFDRQIEIEFRTTVAALLL